MRSVLDRLDREDVQLNQPRYLTLPLSVYEGTWTHSPTRRTLFPPPQPSVPVRSHLGAFSGDLSEGESIMEGFYINTIASPMKREKFTTDLRVHSY